LGSVYEQSNLFKLSFRQRIDECTAIIKNSGDESLRGEAVWVLGATASEIANDDAIKDMIGDLLEFVIVSDFNDVVKHEACFQLGEYNFKKKIPVLVQAALNDRSELVRHEAVEALGLIQAFDERPVIMKALQDEKECVRQTAVFVLKQLDRLEQAQQ